MWDGLPVISILQVIPNTFLGLSAGQSNTTGNSNTFVGDSTGYSNTTGNVNTFLGRQAGYFNKTGGYNTFLGGIAGWNNLWGTYNTFIGFDAGVSVTYNFLENSMALGSGARVTASNTVSIGNTSIASIKGQVSFSTYSDERFKRSIRENVPGLDFVLNLRPVSYQMDAKGIASFLGEDEVQSVKDGENEEVTARSRKSRDEARTAKSKIRYTGFLAQEVAKVADKMGYDFSGIDRPQNERSLYGLRYAEFVVPLVKAVQEQQQVIEEQEEQLQEQEERIEKLESLVQQLLDSKK